MQLEAVNTPLTIGIPGVTAYLAQLVTITCPVILLNRECGRGRRLSVSMMGGRYSEGTIWQTDMVCMIWQATYTNGAMTGTIRSTTALLL